MMIMMMMTMTMMIMTPMTTRTTMTTMMMMTINLAVGILSRCHCYSRVQCVMMFC